MTILGICTTTPLWNYLIVGSLIWSTLSILCLVIMVAGAAYQTFLGRYEN